MTLGSMSFLLLLNAPTATKIEVTGLRLEDQDSLLKMITGELQRGTVVFNERIAVDELAKWEKQLSFKEFLDYQNPSILESESFDLYNQYKDKFLKSQLEAFYEEHKKEAWFMERYSHAGIEKYELVELEQLVERSQKFNQSLKEGKFANLNLSFTNSADNEKIKEQEESWSDNEEDKADSLKEIHKEGLCGVTPNAKNILLVKNIPASITNQQIMEMCQKCPGLEHVSFGEISVGKKLQRMAWLVFSDDIDMTGVYQMMESAKSDEFQLNFAIHKSGSLKVRSSGEPFDSEERLRKDWKMVKEIVQAFDARSKLEDKFSFNEEINQDSPIESIKKELDLAITYLRFVHLYCYYCGLQASSYEDLIKNCGNIHLRKVKDDSIAKSNVTKIVDSNNQVTLKRLGQHFVQSFAKNSDSEVMKLVFQLEDEKYKCLLCNKLFKAPEFVSKHIKLKHPEKMEDIEAECAFFNNFLKNPCSVSIPELNFSTEEQMKEDYQSLASKRQAPVRPPPREYLFI